MERHDSTEYDRIDSNKITQEAKDNTRIQGTGKFLRLINGYLTGSCYTNLIYEYDLRSAG